MKKLKSGYILIEGQLDNIGFMLALIIYFGPVVWILNNSIIMEIMIEKVRERKSHY